MDNRMNYIINSHHLKRNLLIRLIFIFLCIVSLLGCFQPYKEYGLKSKEISYSWGTVRSKLIGTEKKPFFNVIIGSPYKLFISFGSDSYLQGAIKISEIKLKYANTGEIVFEKKNIPEQVITKSKNLSVYKAYFSFKGIDAKYENMILNIKFLLRQGTQSTEINSEIYFYKDYKSDWRIIGV